LAGTGALTWHGQSGGLAVSGGGEPVELYVGIAAALEAPAVVRQLQTWLNPCVAVPSDPHGGEWPRRAALLQHVAGEVALLGVKLAEGSGSLLLRLQSLAEHDTEVVFELGRSLRGAGWTDIDERPAQHLPAPRASGLRVVAALPPYALATLALELG